MMILLFSAFATIFQVEKYNLKKIIVMLVVMALLVNFSYPIAVFIMDFSNSAMYFFIDKVVTPTSGENASRSAVIANLSDVGQLSYDLVDGSFEMTGQLILSIIFMFVLFVTLFAFAINFLIRIVAFVVLLIFSPAGFAFSFFPGTSNLSSSWWSSLFKYAFMGPIMAMSLYLATLLLTDTTSEVTYDENFLTSALYYIVAIVFLWSGLIMSNKFGGSASSTAMRAASATGNKIRGYAQSGAWGAAKFGGRLADDATGNMASGGVRGVGMKLKRMGQDYESRSKSRASKIAQGMGVTGAEEQNMMNQAADYKKKGMSPDALKSLARNGDAAAAHLLAENKNMDQDTYNSFSSSGKVSVALKNKVDSKVKQTRADLVAINKTNDTKAVSDIMTEKGWTEDRAKRHIITKEIGSLNAEQYGQQNWGDIEKEYKKKTSATATSVQKKEAAALATAVRHSHRNMAATGKTKVGNNMSTNNAAALNKTFGVAV